MFKWTTRVRTTMTDPQKYLPRRSKKPAFLPPPPLPEYQANLAEDLCWGLLCWQVGPEAVRVSEISKDTAERKKQRQEHASG